MWLVKLSLQYAHIWREFKILMRTFKRQCEINLRLRHSIPYVTLHLSDLQSILPINEILMTKKATCQPNQFTVICCLPPWSSASTIWSHCTHHNNRPIFRLWDLFKCCFAAFSGYRPQPASNGSLYQVLTVMAFFP